MGVNGSVLTLPGVYTAQTFTGFSLPNSISNHTPNTNCGVCSGVNKYNNQLPEDNNCSFVQAPQNNPPAMSEPTPLNLVPPSAPSTLPPLVGQFIPSYFNPATQVPPSQGSPGYNTSTRCAPQQYTPNTQIPVIKPMVTQTPITSNPSEPNPCVNQTGGYNWNLSGSSALPILMMQASMPNLPMYTPSPPYPAGMTPDMPSLVNSGLRRSSVTPNDMCVL